jgi:hypothetical protein
VLSSTQILLPLVPSTSICWSQASPELLRRLSIVSVPRAVVNPELYSGHTVCMTAWTSFCDTDQISRSGTSDTYQHKISNKSIRTGSAPPTLATSCVAMGSPGSRVIARLPGAYLYLLHTLNNSCPVPSHSRLHNPLRTTSGACTQWLSARIELRFRSACIGGIRS